MSSDSNSAGNTGRGTSAPSGPACVEVRRHPVPAPEEPAGPSPPPQPTDRTRGRGGRGGGEEGAGGEKGDHTDSSTGEPLLPLPREPGVHTSNGGDAARSDERMAALAAAILVACLRRKGPLDKTTNIEREPQGRVAGIVREGQVSRARAGDAGHNGVPARTALPEAGASSSSRETARAPPLPPSPSKRNGHNLRRYTRSGSGTGAAAGTGKGERDAKKTVAPRRSRERKRSLSWRRKKRLRASNPENEDSDTPSASTDRKPQVDRGSSHRDGKSDQSDGAEVGRYILGQVPGSDTGDGAGRPTALQRLFLNRRGGVAAPCFLQLERLGAVSRAPELLNSPSMLLQELGVVILERAIEELEGQEEEKEEEEEEGGDEEGTGGRTGNGIEELVDTTTLEGELRLRAT